MRLLQLTKWFNENLQECCGQNVMQENLRQYFNDHQDKANKLSKTQFKKVLEDHNYMCGNSSGFEILRKQIKYGEDQTYQETQWILGGKKKGMVVKGVRMLHLRHEGDASEMVANSGDMKAWGASRFS